MKLNKKFNFNFVNFAVLVEMKITVMRKRINARLKMTRNIFDALHNCYIGVVLLFMECIFLSPLIRSNLLTLGSYLETVLNKCLFFAWLTPTNYYISPWQTKRNFSMTEWIMVWGKELRQLVFLLRKLFAKLLVK